MTTHFLIFTIQTIPTNTTDTMPESTETATAPQQQTLSSLSSLSSSCLGRRQRPIISKWRLAEAEQFSDWTVEVSTKSSSSSSPSPSSLQNDGSLPSSSSEEEQTPPPAQACYVYRLHKVYLGVESGYFRSMMNNNNNNHSTTNNTNSNTNNNCFFFKDSQEAKTVLELEPSAVKAFPEFLDFIYGSHDGIFSTESAVALKHLAEYLQVDSLTNVVSSYIQEAITVEHIDVFYNEAILYSDMETLNLCLQAIAKLPRTELLDSSNNNSSGGGDGGGATTEEDNNGNGGDDNNNDADADDNNNNDGNTMKAARQIMLRLPEAQQRTVLQYALGYAEQENKSLRKRIRDDAIRRKKKRQRISLLPPRLA